MIANPWLAIDLGTAPTVRALELKDAWERFIAGLARASDEGDDPEVVRAPIADSWRRSFAAGIDPAGGSSAPLLADPGETRALWEEHPLAAVAPLIRDCLSTAADETLVVVADAAGLLLHIEGSAAVRSRAADMMNFAEGALWSERGAGTNAIGTALAVDHAVQVFAAEHFNEVVQRWTCSAAPIHDPDTGALLGAIDLTGDLSTVHPHSLAVAAAAAQAVEASLRFALLERDERLRARFGDRVAGPGPRALVTPSGRVLAAHRWPDHGAGRLAIPPGGGELVLASGTRAVAEAVDRDAEAFVVRALERGPGGSPLPLLRLSLLGRDRGVVQVGDRRVELRPRHAEILALLAAHPEGVSADVLCAELHGDAGSPGSVRVEISRLRKLIGPCIDTERYRLTCPVQTDAGRVEGLLRAGAIREAAERYAGPLLPGSEAPGVVRERDGLDCWLRQAVMTSDDAEALWAWVHCASGSADLGAWKRLLAHLEFRDPRRSQAAARVAQLRDALAAS
jgi:hypothetical protein